MRRVRSTTSISVRTSIILVLCTLATLTLRGGEPQAAEPPAGKLGLAARNRVEAAKGSGTYRWAYTKLEWDPRKTAVIVCDMWDEHWCKGATRRVAEMAPRMNEAISRAREKGVLLVHAPSETMDHYKDHPARLRAQKAPRASTLPDGIGGGCGKIPSEERGKWPIDQSDGGCDCEPQCKVASPWRSQIATIEIRDDDFISDSGVEIWNVLAERGVDNVILMGVHTNMCVIGRPFGLRNMVRFGKNVALMRDLTDTMYNSRKWPGVNHFTGTDFIAQHIEKFVCPTIASSDFTGKEPFRFSEDKRPRVVLLSAENEYGAADAFPELARYFQLKCGLAAEVLQGSTGASGPEIHRIPCMQALDGADLAVLYARRRAIPAADMKRFRDYLARGKPLIAFRTSSHAFSVGGGIPQGCEEWKEFDREVLGCSYRGHASGETRVTLIPEASDHPILKGLGGPYQVKETLYSSLPLAPTCRALLLGKTVEGVSAELKDSGQPVAWTNTYKGARIFYTSLGSAESSFREKWFNRMVVNAVFWALDRPVPEGAVDA